MTDCSSFKCLRNKEVPTHDAGRRIHSHCQWKTVCLPAINFLVLFCLKEEVAKSTCRDIKLLNCVYHPWKFSEALLECVVFLTKAKCLEHFFSLSWTHFLPTFSGYIIEYDNHFLVVLFHLLCWWAVSIILWCFIYLIFQYDMNQNKFFTVIKSKVFFSVCTLSVPHSISVSS